MELRTMYIKVAGVTLEGRQAHIAALRGDEPVRIVPEPENKFDPNALAVHVAMTDGVKHVGFVPRRLAAVIAPLLDGEALMVAIDEITGGFEIEDGYLANYGLALRAEVPDEQPDDVPF